MNLAGRLAKTALWCTNIGNEHRQLLTSVMTAGEGHGLDLMLVGVINRFKSAKISYNLCGLGLFWTIHIAASVKQHQLGTLSSNKTFGIS